MRLRIQRTQNDAHCYAIESTYSGGKHSSKVVMKLGLESEIRKEHPEPEKWAREYLSELTRKEKEEGGVVCVDYHPQEHMKLGEQSTWNGGCLFLQQMYAVATNLDDSVQKSFGSIAAAGKSRNASES